MIISFCICYANTKSDFYDLCSVYKLLKFSLTRRKTKICTVYVPDMVWYIDSEILLQGKLALSIADGGGSQDISVQIVL